MALRGRSGKVNALTHDRVYKEAFSHEKAKAMIVHDRGSRFDPVVVDAFLACEDLFLEATGRYN